MKKPRDAQDKELITLTADSLDKVRGGLDVQYSDGTRSGGDDDDTGPIVIIGRDGP